MNIEITVLLGRHKLKGKTTTLDTVDLECGTHGVLIWNDRDPRFPEVAGVYVVRNDKALLFDIDESDKPRLDRALKLLYREFKESLKRGEIKVLAGKAGGNECKLVPRLADTHYRGFEVAPLWRCALIEADLHHWLLPPPDFQEGQDITDLFRENFRSRDRLTLAKLHPPKCVLNGCLESPVYPYCDPAYVVGWLASIANTTGLALTPVIDFAPLPAVTVYHEDEAVGRFEVVENGDPPQVRQDWEKLVALINEQAQQNGPFFFGGVLWYPED